MQGNRFHVVFFACKIIQKKSFYKKNEEPGFMLLPKLIFIFTNLFNLSDHYRKLCKTKKDEPYKLSVHTELYRW